MLNAVTSESVTVFKTFKSEIFLVVVLIKSFVVNIKLAVWRSTGEHEVSERT